MRCAADVLVGTSSGSQSLSLSQSLTLRISPLSFRSLTLSGSLFLSPTHSTAEEKLTFPSLDSVPLSLSVYLSHTHKTTPPLEIDGEKYKESSKLFLYQKQRPAIAAKCKEDWDWNGLIPPYVERARANVNKCVSWRGVGGETLAQSIVVRDNFC